MKLKKQFFLPILLSLSVFFSSFVMTSASAYAATAPKVAAVYDLAASAPNNTELPGVDTGKDKNPGGAKSGDDGSFFDRVFEKIALMFLVYMFFEAIQSILNELFHDGDIKIKVTPREKQGTPGQKGTDRNINRIPSQDV